jgi:SNF2 family DNA or RNA helicase
MFAKLLLLLGASKAFCDSIFQYQLDGIARLFHIIQTFHGALLCDEQGLGKTLQAILLTLIGSRFPDIAKILGVQPGNILIVCETSTMTAWENEIFRTGIPTSVHQYKGRSRQYEYTEFTIVSYETLRQDYRRKNFVLFQESFSFVILDEVHKGKTGKVGSESAIYKMLCDLNKMSIKIGLSGTLLACDAANEAASILNIVFPEHSVGIHNLQDICVRRTAAETIQLPPLHVQSIYVDLTCDEWAAYTTAFKHCKKAFTSYITAMHSNNPTMRASLFQMRAFFMGKLTKLRQASNTFSKLDVIQHIIDPTIPTIIFSSFLNVLHQLKAANPTALMMSGEDNSDGKAEIIEKFQTGETNLLLLSTKAAYTGITLTRAVRVILVDSASDPNPVIEEQAVKRAHRIGSDHDVYVYRMVSRHTMDDAVSTVIHVQRREVIHKYMDGDVNVTCDIKSVFEAIESTYLKKNTIVR